VLVYLTSLEFSYTNSPPGVKTILQAFFLLTLSLGNGLLALLSLLSHLLANQQIEFLLYALIQSFAALIFYFQSRHFRYRTPNGPEAPIELQALDAPTTDNEEAALVE
jgi:solute carrier family 15 oligopeptide transporter 1